MSYPTPEEISVALTWLRKEHKGTDAVPVMWEQRVFFLLIALDRRIMALEHELDERLPLEHELTATPPDAELVSLRKLVDEVLYFEDHPQTILSVDWVPRARAIRGGKS